MIKNNQILLGKAEDTEVYLLLNQMNRHGLIAGASGTGKTVTLKVIAESLSEAGVPTLIADVKTDLSGMITPGDPSAVAARLESMNETFECRKFPVHFYDVYRKSGHPVRAKLQEIDPVVLARMFDLTDAQEGIMHIIFAVARDMNLDIIDLKDLRAMTGYVYEHAKELGPVYGNVSKQSVSTIQRKLLELENQDGDLFFGMPSLSIDDLFQVEGGLGVMNILECEKLYQHPMLYSSFLLWILDRLYQELPEVGDLEKPKLVFFFDEAHLLFDNASKPLLEKINQIVKLIRSKGVGIFFCTQSPTDIPSSVLAQLSNRIQHSLRAYTPSEIKAVKQAADSFRANPDFETADVIANMETGWALVSALDEKGAPSIVQKTKIMPPQSSMKAADAETIQKVIQSDSIFGKYEKDIDPESAYEQMDDIKAAEEKAQKEEIEAKKAAKLQEQKEKAAAREAAKKEAQKKKQSDYTNRIAKKATNRLENEIVNIGFRSAKKILKDFLK